LRRIEAFALAFACRLFRITARDKRLPEAKAQTLQSFSPGAQFRLRRMAGDNRAEAIDLEMTVAQRGGDAAGQIFGDAIEALARHRQYIFR
jgi:hypothetical protein